ncbi:choice-of-anchor D domain-containing protein [Occallatibacter riparius]|uniref:Choice-of-anchor D domain-containing protein n=1 Tax=Occallatibacter riparius TaxID=1002689 RepID=A0A9J7BVN5_9BACT|nr:choice-of-anchor D domain-containing protein [Occallatibacter riparius]UWZ85850.1 choice-of-anchor D domain-containing protein [Occallatibacter riparius]
MTTFSVSPRGSLQQARLQLMHPIHAFTLRILITCFLGLMSAPALLFADTPNPIQQENSLPGTSGWANFTASSQQDLLSGFGSKISANHGDSIAFYVTTTDPSFTIDIYRTGYYQGIGARLVQSLGSFTGVHQAISAPDPVTGMISCSNWTAATTVQIPASWVTGVYLAKLTSSSGNSSFIFFVVRNDGGTEDVLYQTSVTTYQAYNLWGGTSLYGNTTDKSVYPYPHATKVSFDRPFIPGDSNGAGQYLDYEYAFVYWMESQGYNISYSTDVDTDQGTAPITNHKAFLSVGHDEYWSRAMRTNVQNAINSGVSAGFFGANTMFWQIRFEPNASGVPNRVQVGYKDFATSPSSPGPDPEWGFDNSLVTTQWRDATINEPENGIVGIMSESAASADYVVQNSSNWVYANSGLVDGSTVPGLVGYEYDRIYNNGFTPPGLVVLSTSPLTNSSGASSYANSSIYTAPSGAKVFASGTIVWSLGLANVMSNTRANAGIQQTTANLLNNFILGVPVATLSPSSANFNGITVGVTSSPQTIMLTNAGTGTLNINSIGLSGANPGDFAETNNCPATLTVNQSCAINVTFTPTAVGPRSATLAITDNAANSPQSVALSGTGQAAAAPIVSFNPTSLTFGSQNVGTSSTAQSITLSNVGTASLNIGSIALTGSNSGDFSSKNTCPNLLAANASCTINVTFSPTANGTRSANLTVTDNAADSPESVALTGSAFAPTVFFQDGFESGNFSLWNLQSGDSTGQRTIQTQVVNSGTSAAAFTNSTGQYAYIYTAQASPQPQTFTRFYLRLANTTTSTQVAIGRNANGGNSWEIDYDTNRHGLDIYFWDGSGGVYSLFSATNSVAANTWYCVEVGDTQTTTGQAQAWLNGVSLGTVNADLSNANPFARLMLLNTVTGTFYFDDVAISNFYNGPVNSKPAAILNPTSLVFGNQGVGTTSAAQTVTLSNQGAAPLTISSIAVSGTNSGDFAQTGNCPTGSNTLGVNTSCTINITFTPGATGARSAALVITDNDTTGTQTVPLSGSGAAAGVTVTPTSLTYSSQVVGTSSTAQTITVKSTGTAPLSISSITLSGTNPGDFAQTNNCPTGSNTLAINATCTINVTFSPAASGTRSAIIAISDNAPTHAQNVSLSGSATAANLTLTPSSLTYSNQVVGIKSTAQTITVKSIGTAPLKISGIVIGGTNAGDFAQTSNCPTGTNTLAINSTCTISVTFTPTARGTRAGTVTVNSNAPGTPPSVSLSGTGTGPVASLSPASLTFAALAIGSTSSSQSVTLSNTGNATLHITSIAVTGDFAKTTTCSSTLAANSSCTVSVTFKPTAAGTRTGTLTVSDDSTGGSSQSTSLTGTGVDFALSASPSSATVTAGGKATYTITVSALGGSFNSAVKLACSNLPSASSCTFTSTSLTPGTGSASTTLSISTSAGLFGLFGTPKGTYTITISGTSGSTIRTTPVTLQVK